MGGLDAPGAARPSRTPGQVMLIDDANYSKNRPFSQAAPALAALGYLPLPIEPGTKKVTLDNWPNYRFRAADAARYANHGVGLLCGQGDVPAYAADVDVTDPDLNARICAKIEARYPAAPRRIGRAPKALYIFRGPAGKSKQVIRIADGQKIEILGNGQQFVIEGIHPETGRPYRTRWVDELIGDNEPVPAAELPVLDDEFIAELRAEFGQGDGAPATASGSDWSGPPKPPLGVTLEQAAKIIEGVGNVDYDIWLDVGFALHHEFNGSADALAVWDAWSKGATNYSPGACAHKWLTFGGDGLTLRGLIKKYRLPYMVVVNPKAHVDVAKQYIEWRQTHHGKRTLLFWRDTYYKWSGSAWEEDEDIAVRADVQDFLANACYVQADGGPQRLRPTAPYVGYVLSALKSLVLLSKHTEPGTWIDGSNRAAGLVAMQNGLLDLATRSLYPHDPGFFNVNVLPFPWQPDAPAPREWMGFLHSVWGDDPEAVTMLQEYAGYVVSGQTRYQKALMLIGPRRSGKGIMSRTIGKMIGDANTAAVTLTGLTRDFGLQQLIDKPLCVIGDARIGGGADQHLAVERILSITGEDRCGVARKNKTDWVGKLPTRFIVCSNELPRLTDASGAVASRFIVLETEHSYFDREDHSLEDRVQTPTELAAIFKWALDGWDRLAARGRFLATDRTRALQSDLEGLSSPVKVFLGELCELGPDKQVECATLYHTFRRWAVDNGHPPPSIGIFGRDLRSAAPGLKILQPRTAGGRVRVYQGVALRVQNFADFGSDG